MLFEESSAGFHAALTRAVVNNAVCARVGIDTFDAATLTNRHVTALMASGDRVDTVLDRGAAPLTHAHVRITLRDGQELNKDAQGARGYPEQPASDAELDAKFKALRMPHADRVRGGASARPAERNRRAR